MTKKVQTTITLQQLEHAFSVYLFKTNYDSLDTYDACHDGTISMKSLFEAFTKYSPTPMSDDDARELIKEVSIKTRADSL